MTLLWSDSGNISQLAEPCKLWVPWLSGASLLPPGGSISIQRSSLHNMLTTATCTHTYIYTHTTPTHTLHIYIFKYFMHKLIHAINILTCYAHLCMTLMYAMCTNAHHPYVPCTCSYMSYAHIYTAFLSSFPVHKEPCEDPSADIPFARRMSHKRPVGPPDLFPASPQRCHDGEELH